MIAFVTGIAIAAFGVVISDFCKAIFNYSLTFVACSMIAASSGKSIGCT